MEKEKSYRYSEHFKQSVLDEVRRGNSNIKAIARDYGISESAVYQWLKKYKMPTPKREVIFIDMAQKHSLEDQIKEMQKEILKLKDALSKETIERMKYQALVQAAEELTGMDFKKKVGMKQ